MAPARVASAPTEPPRWAQAMPPTDRPVTQDATCTGGLGRITLAPERHWMLRAQLAPARAPPTGPDRMAPARAPRQCRVFPAPSEAAPGRLASGAHALAAHPAPAVCHVPHEWGQAVSGPMAPHERAASQAVTDATAPRARWHRAPHSAGEEAAQRRGGRPPQHPRSREPAEPALDTARRAPKRLWEQRAQGQTRLRGMGHA